MKSRKYATVTKVASQSYPGIYVSMAYATDASLPAFKNRYKEQHCSTYEKRIYKMVQITSEPRMPKGISFFGFFAS
jgi:hypothetical protein